MLSQIALDSILFIDIETVPQYSCFGEVPDDFKKFWEKKCNYLRKNEETVDELYSRAGIYAEFGKIICVSTGFIMLNGKEKKFRLKSFFGEEEQQFLPQFIEMLNGFSTKRDLQLCAHNGKEFDFPYLGRRILINGLKLPDLLNVAGKKPWEVKFLDTMELWKFGDYKHFTSLDLLTRLFQIPSPKSDIDGSMVASVFYEEDNLERIVEYCQNDVIAIAQLFLKYTGNETIPQENIEIVK